MFIFEIATLPTRQSPKQRMLARGEGGPEIGHARTNLSGALARLRLDAPALAKVLSGVGEVWTDFPEYGITVRLYPRTVTVQCQRVLPNGARCQRPVAVAHGARVAYCWQHSAR